MVSEKTSTLIKKQLKAGQLVIPDTPQDQTTKRKVGRQAYHQMIWRSQFLQSSYNFSRLQAGGFTYAMLPGLKQIHQNKDDLAYAMLDHLKTFNTHPFLVTYIQGVILAMEEQKNSRSLIRTMKAAMMGPLGGVGDTLFWLALLPVTAGIGASIGMTGNIFGPILFLLLFNLAHLAVMYYLMSYGYHTGTKAITTLKDITKKVSRAATIVGLTVIGGLVAAYVQFDFKVALSVDVTYWLNLLGTPIMALGYTFCCYWLLKKGWSPLLLMGISTVIGIIFSFFQIIP